MIKFHNYNVQIFPQLFFASQANFTPSLLIVKCLLLATNYNVQHPTKVSSATFHQKGIQKKGKGREKQKLFRVSKRHPEPAVQRAK